MLRQIISLIVIFTAGLCFFIVLQDRLLSYEREKRDRELQKAHEDALNQFSGSIERFATLMTGLRSYLNEAETMPLQQEVADFFAYQTDFLSANDSITISFLDTSHIFNILSIRNNQTQETLLVNLLQHSELMLKSKDFIGY